MNYSLIVMFAELALWQTFLILGGIFGLLWLFALHLRKGNRVKTVENEIRNFILNEVKHLPQEHLALLEELSFSDLFRFFVGANPENLKPLRNYMRERFGFVILPYEDLFPKGLPSLPESVRIAFQQKEKTDVDSGGTGNPSFGDNGEVIIAEDGRLPVPRNKDDPYGPASDKDIDSLLGLGGKKSGSARPLRKDGSEGHFLGSGRPGEGRKEPDISGEGEE